MPTLPQQMTAVNNTATPPATLPANFNFGSPAPQAGNAPATLPADFNFGAQAQPQPQVDDFGTMLSKAFSGTVAGVKQVGTGFMQTVDAAKGGDLALMGRGILNEAGGGLNTLASPITNVINNLGAIPVNGNGDTIGSQIQKNGIQPIADKISDLKPLQNFMQMFPHADEVLANIGTIIAAFAGGGKGEETMNAIDESLPKGKTDIVPPDGGTPETPEINPVVGKRVSVLQQIEDNSSPVRRIVTDATNRGVDVKNLVANTDLLQGSVDENGNISTLGKGEAVDQFNQFMDNYEKVVSEGLGKEGKSIPFSDVEQALRDSADSSRIAGGGKTRLNNFINQEIEGLRLDADENGNISLKKLQDAKISTNDGIDYTKPESKINAKMVANTYKTLIEDNSSLDVTNLNAELTKYYKIGDYLETLNGRKVAGGKLGKYFAHTVGAITGSHFGPLGSIIGAELAGKIKGFSLSSTFGPEVGGEIEASAPMKAAVEQNKQPRIGLPAPKEGTPKVQNNVPIEMGGKSTIEKGVSKSGK